jgi:hypothetical protein
VVVLGNLHQRLSLSLPTGALGPPSVRAERPLEVRVLRASMSVVAHLLSRRLDVGPNERRVGVQTLERVRPPARLVGVLDRRRRRRGRNALRVRVRVSSSAVDVVEEEEADDVGQQTERADDHDDPGVGDLGHGDEALDALEEDGEAEREEEDSVDERT